MIENVISVLCMCTLDIDCFVGWLNMLSLEDSAICMCTLDIDWFVGWLNMLSLEIESSVVAISIDWFVGLLI